MNYDEIIIKNIRNIINERGLKQKSVAEKAGIPLETFYSITSGRRKVSTDYIPPIAKALEVTPNDLFQLEKVS